MRYFLMIVFGLSLLQARAQQEGAANIEFTENKGQWDAHALFRGLLPNGAFFLQKNGFKVIMHDTNDLHALVDGHRFENRVQNSANKSLGRSPTDINRNRPSLMHSHAYSVTFVGANENAIVEPDKPVPGPENFIIGNDSSAWATNCRVYQGITYKNIYPNIDLRYYSHDGQLKYDVIVYPGGDPTKVMLKYEGINSIQLIKNKLLIKTSVGNVQELSPYAYQPDVNGRSEVKCSYVLEPSNIVRFNVKSYSPNTTLVIDPSLVFCSFSGSKVGNWGFTATPGPDGSFFGGGIVFGSGFPVNNGAYQTNFAQGGFDVGIIKLSSDGRNRLYATYLGGGGAESPHSMFCDPQGNLVVMGRTYSQNFPVTKKIGPGGANTFPNTQNAKLFITKLNSSGSGLIGSIVIGGSNNDGINIEDQHEQSHEEATSLIRNYGDDSRSEVILDAANNIYVASSSQSPDFPVTPGAFQNSLGGKQDGIVLKIDPSCNNLIWASFLGGSQDDGAFVLKLNPATQDIYVAGATASANFPGPSGGTIQPSYAGGTADGFITIISNDGKTRKKSTFLGTKNLDIIYGIEFDKKGFPYVMGITTGDWPVLNAAFVNAGAKQFVSKLKPDLSAFVYSTTFGTNSSIPNISPVALLVDRCENVYVSGWGGWLFSKQSDPYGLAGTVNMPVTNDAIKKVTDGRDFYFIVIQKNAASLLYGTFFGQTEGEQSISEHVDGGTSRYDQQGRIYQAICANCNGGSRTPFPTTRGSWAYQNGTRQANGQIAGCNLAALKIAFNFAGVAAGLKATIDGRRDTSGCVPLDVVFSDTLRIGKQYIWSFGDGSPDTTTTDFNVTHTYLNVGKYTVRLIAIDSNTCNISDTVYTHIIAGNNRAVLAFNASKLPPCQSLSYQFVNQSTAPPALPFNPKSFAWDFGDGSPLDTAGTETVTHTYPAQGSYVARLILLDTQYCNAPDDLSDTLHIAALVKARINTPPTGCAPYEAVFNNASDAGQQFFWDFGDGTTSTNYSPTHLYSTVGTYTVKLVVVDSSTCNIIDSTSVTITVNPRPTAGLSATPVEPAANTPYTFYNNSSGAVRYEFLFGDGDSVLKSNKDTTIHQYQLPGNYEACLVAYNEFGCTDTACVTVEAIITPLLDVPNAFTPGRFGQNAIVMVKGFGIANMTWRIYNRWGQIVFESNNPELGWDGTYKGNPQPMDVYAYTLEVQYFDGTKASKKGDITLIR